MTFAPSNSTELDNRYAVILGCRTARGLSNNGLEEGSKFGIIAQPLFELSDYLFRQLQSSPHWLDDLSNLIVIDADEVSLNITALASLSPRSNEIDVATLSEDDLMKALRCFRNQWLCRLIFLDLLQCLELTHLTKLLSELADEAITLSVNWSVQNYQTLYGRALDRDKEEQSLIVIGMGKLGGGELNLSSDIDLIFAFREHGETTGGKKSISHQEYFTKIGQKLIQHLDRITVNGFVFRVDMRLRPYGQSGPLVANIDSLENYYQDQGREWERYAMIKARVIVGTSVDKKAFESIRKPFVYRKYLDFAVIGALRDLKRMIAKEVQIKGIEHNIKLGKGGIREIEFIAQALQILHGGRDAGLQPQSLYHILPYLQAHDYLPKQQVEALWQAYTLLRRTEHALQAINDEQTHLLPQASQQQQRLAIMLGYEAWSDLDAELSQHRQRVSQYFSELIEEEIDDTDTLPARETWRLLLGQHPDLQGSNTSETNINATTLDQAHILPLIQQVSWQDPEQIVQRLTDFLTAKPIAYMQPIGRDRLAFFFADLIDSLQQEEAPDDILLRTFPILEAVLRRTSYLVLLVENPTAIQHLIRLNRESAWFANMIANMPALLDELLDANSLFSPPDKQKMADELQQILLRLPEDDDEAHMDALRRFRLSILLRIAACDVANILPVMKVSDHLTWLAEVLLDQVLQKAWHALTQRHGYPTQGENVVQTPEMVLVGYGKSGGLELGYDSDLDLVFLHNTDISSSTNGDRVLDNVTFYTRLGQRIIHILTTFTSCGRLYEVDMRLRPSGNSGLLITSLDGFIEYQQKEAWTWEHQALTRARVLSGDSKIAQRFNQARSDLLAKKRDQQLLKTEVMNMREKMRTHLDTASNAMDFDLKQGAGGIIDIEFIVQYLVLGWSHQYPELALYSDNMRQLEMAEKNGVLDHESAQDMMVAYQKYRSHTHRLSLQEKTRVIAADWFQVDQERIKRIWQTLFS
ncbi:bifunctional [glutamate--ammonia ligase]-adenylyl-L-tyrosine phosphorylase/[glutamate--ammonia-ligase] adenylyltransferase [Marinomonas agarivorans]|nr:bifunctional [glutamate--ammonia ligase]-adenylyl-L-tyrosine phosphorylase/[glutamate--ammonia-ligase] adenylyltransferase [Marinomonas agarivorans]